MAADQIHALVDAGDWRRARELLANLDEDVRAHPTLAKWAQALAPASVRIGGPGSAVGLDENLAWLREHASEHQGEWVALRAGTLVGHAESRSVLSQLLRARHEAPGALLVWCGTLDHLP